MKYVIVMNMLINRTANEPIILVTIKTNTNLTTGYDVIAKVSIFQNHFRNAGFNPGAQSLSTSNSVTVRFIPGNYYGHDSRYTGFLVSFTETRTCKFSMICHVFQNA